MKQKIKQKGGLLINLFLFIVLGFLFVYGIQISFAYIAQQTIKGAVRTSLIDMKTDEDNANPRKLKDSILKKLSVNDIDLGGDDIVISKDGRSFVVNVNFSKEIGLGDKAKIVLDLSFEETTPR